MSDEDDDSGSGTLVMPPEERGARPASLPDAPKLGAPPAYDPTNDGDAPGTFIMTPAHHASKTSPVSPYADPSRASQPQVRPGLEPTYDPALATHMVAHGDNMLPPLPAPRDSPQPFNMAPSALPPAPRVPSFPGIPEAQPFAAAPPPMSPTASPGPQGFPPPGGFPAAASPSGGSLGPLALGAAVGLVTVGLTVGGYYLYRFRSSPDTPPAVASATDPPAEPGSTSEPTTPAVKTATASHPAGDEAVARAALERLGEGIKICTASIIGKIPGTSPAVPSAHAFLKKGPYQPSAKDFQSPVYSCAKFSIDTPMPFVIQFQNEVPNKKGVAIAWIDEDKDGRPDKALGFEATLVDGPAAEIGPIKEMDASREIKKASVPVPKKPPPKKPAPKER